RMSRHLVQRERGEVEHGDDEDAQPAGDEEDAHGPKVVAVLRRQPAAELVAGPQMIESGVPVDRSWNLETGRAKQAGVHANGTVERNHHLGREQTVVAGPGSAGVGDVVAQEVAWPDRGAS